MWERSSGLSAVRPRYALDGRFREFTTLRTRLQCLMRAKNPGADQLKEDRRTELIEG